MKKFVKENCELAVSEQILKILCSTDTMQSTSYLALFTLFCLYYVPATSGPIAEIRKRSIDTDATLYNSVSGKPMKKDVFISRGWGAGGMPFSVLYMSPYSSKLTAQQPYKTLPVVSRTMKEQQHQPQRPKALAQVRNSMGNSRRKQYSIIPQLFVSYGWGPLGK